MFLTPSLSWTVSVPSLPPRKQKPAVVAGSGGSASSNLRKVSAEHNSDIWEISLMKLPPTHIAKSSLLIAVLGI